MDPERVRAVTWLSKAYAAAGRHAEALRTAEAGIARLGRLPPLLSIEAALLAALGRRAEARRLLQELSESASSRYVAPSLLARPHWSLGEPDAAMGYLEQAYQARSAVLPFCAMEPWWTDCRADPRFRDLLARMGLP